MCFESLTVFFSDESSGFGPVFEEQPVDTIYPEESPEDKIIMNCRTRANPPATYRWRLDNTEIVIGNDDHYSLMGGNLVISFPDKSKHAGNYSCLASNEYGTLVSQKASVQFGYLDMFSSDERQAVYVKEGQGAVLLCAPPPHFPEDLSFRWMLNEFPEFILLDKRRFVSQTTGNLYISTVRASDSGNYSCFVSSPSIAKSVFSKFIPLVPIAERSLRKYPADIKVKSADTYTLLGQNVTLECFQCPNNHSEHLSSRIVTSQPSNHPEYLRNLSLSSDATKITLAPSNADISVGESTRMECAASHDPSLDLTFIWSLDARAIDFDQDREHYERKTAGTSSSELLISNTQLRHAGRYSCTAQTPVDNVTVSAELVVRGPPGPPGGVRVDGVMTSSVRVTWSHGTDNLSPISKYSVQYRDVRQEWRDASTSPVNVEGNAEMSSVINLTPWTEYEFRVIATNTLGTGPPSDPSPTITTREARPVVAPSEIGGGGGTSRELTITWTPVQPQYYYGSNFGYIIAFKPHKEWVIIESMRIFCATSAVQSWMLLISISFDWPEGQPNGVLYTTVKQSIDLPMKKGDYLVEVRAHSEGGDGAVAQVRIAGKTTFTLDVNEHNPTSTSNHMIMHNEDSKKK
uniref:Contactin 1 n=1 Tax=Sinocyclocheilus grahami TaxID=75366 RepID=A0A672K3Z4_SINGR